MSPDLAATVLSGAGVGALGRLLNRRAVPIVGYHGVSDVPLDPPCPWIIDVRELERQLRWLAARFRVVRLEEVVSCLAEGRPLPARAAVITFDDGYASVTRLALPILRQCDLPATLFVVTGAVGQPALLWPDRLYLALTRSSAASLDLSDCQGGVHPLGSPARGADALGKLAAFLKCLSVPEKERRLLEIEARCVARVTAADRAPFAIMNEDEVRTVSASGLWTLGSHAQTHEILSRFGAEEQRRLIDDSMTWLRSRTCGAAIAFAYPNGRAEDFDADTVAALRAAGASCAVTAMRGLNRATADRFALRRTMVGHGLALSRFQLRVSGVGVAARPDRSPASVVGAVRFRLRPLRRFVREWVLKRDRVAVYARPPVDARPPRIPPACGDGFSFVRAGGDHLDEVASRLDPRDRPAFRATVARRIADGKTCMALLHGERIVASVWTDCGPRVFIPEVESWLDLGLNAVYLYDASTAPAWRGRGLYPHLLGRAAAAFADRRVLIAVSTRNLASRRGIEKAGFTIIGERRLLKVAGVVCQSTSAGI